MVKQFGFLIPVLMLGLCLAPFVAGDDPFSRLEAAVDEVQRDDAEDFQAFRRQREAEYQAYRQELREEFERFRQIYGEERARIAERLGQVWDEPEFSGQHTWVQYTDDARERRRVDFQNERISISLAGASGIEQGRLVEALTELVTTRVNEAFEADVLAQAVERRSRSELQHLETAEVERRPALYAYLTGDELLDRDRVDAIVSGMIRSQQVENHTDSQGREVVTIDVPLRLSPEAETPVGAGIEEPATEGLVDQSEELDETREPLVQRLPARARSFYGYMEEFAAREDVDPALMYAIMEVESSFNPMATSHVPAYGLMQIVPDSAGQDATEKLFGKPRILAPSYLYNSGNNIEIGTAYFHILYYRYLRHIENPLSRLYCAVAAYNTGAGNVARAFAGRPHIRPAVERINRMVPEEVFAHLVDHLPYQETRDYMHKVFASLERYQP